MNPTAADLAKDLKDLRAAHKALDRPIQRLAVVRLTALAILVFSFGRAFARLEHTDAASLRASLDKVDSALHDKFADPADDPEHKRLQEQLDAVYEKVFTVSLPIPETEVEIDLRYWVYALPFALIVTQLVLLQLARRQRLLAALAARRVAALPPESLDSVDRLMFPAGEGGASRFLGFPGRLLSTLEMAGIVTLLAYLVYVGGPLWRLWGWGGIVAAFAAMATVAYYAIVYDAYARANQEAALATLLPEALPRARRARAWSVVSARAAALAGRVRPKWSLSAGSLLLLLTMLLPLCVTHCGTPMRGADLIRGHAYLESDHAYTETEVPLFSRAPVASLKQEDVSWFGIENGVPGLGRGAYVLALLLAIAAPVVLVLRSRGTPALRRLAAACRAGSMVLWLYVVNSAFASSFALVVFLSGSKGKGDAELLGTLTKTADGAGLIPLIVVGAAFFCACGVLWTRAWNADRRDGGQRWPQLRGRLAIVLLPHAVLGVAFVVTSAIGVGLWGLAAHFAGVSLLALGFGRVDDELRAAPPPAAPAPPVLAGGQPAPG